MYNKIDLYILKKFSKFFAINLIIFLGILWLVKIIDFLELITDQHISFINFLYLSILTICKLASFIIPLVVLVAVIFTFNHFYYSKEIFVFKAAGMSKSQLLKPFILGLSLIILLNYLLLFYLAPFSERNIKLLSTKLANQFLASMLKAGEINKFDDNIRVFIAKKESKNGQVILHNILINYQDRNYQDRKNYFTVIKAQDGQLVKINKKLVLVLNNGVRLLLNQERHIEDKLTFSKYVTNLDFYNEKKDNLIIKKDISEYYISELFVPNLPFSKLEIILEKQQRLLWPWLSMALALIIITILLKGEYSRKGNLLKNIKAIFAALLFLVAYFLITNQFIPHILL